MKKYIVYYRVSTKRQGQSGLGLDAQRQQVSNFVRERNAEILDEYTEIESGTDDDRPQLKAALDAAELFRVPLLIAKLDRLSRSAAFLMTLQESSVEFTCADAPDVCDLTVGVMALMARQEREAISKRTKAALEQAKARGTALGGLREGAHTFTDEDRLASATLRTKRSAAKAEKYRACIGNAIQSGHGSYTSIAGWLEANGVPTTRGKLEWQAVQVQRIMDKLGMTLPKRQKAEDLL